MLHETTSSSRPADKGNPRLDRLRGLAAYHRRWLAGLCVTAAVWVVIAGGNDAPDDAVSVVVAGTDLVPGTTLAVTDLDVVAFADGSVPDGVMPRDAAVGRVLASGLRRGEPVTDARLLTPGLAEHSDGRSVVPLRLADDAVARLLRVGDVVDLVAVDARTGSHRTLSSRARVASVVEASGGSQGDGPLLAMAVQPGDAAAVAAAGANGTVQVILAPAS